MFQSPNDEHHHHHLFVARQTDLQFYGYHIDGTTNKQKESSLRSMAGPTTSYTALAGFDSQLRGWVDLDGVGIVRWLLHNGGCDLRICDGGVQEGAPNHLEMVVRRPGRKGLHSMGY